MMCFPSCPALPLARLYVYVCVCVSGLPADVAPVCTCVRLCADVCYCALVVLAQRWEAYKEVNRIFASKLNDLYTPPNDLLWIHDYPLLLMPSYAVHHHVSPANMGFFLHTPFPSSEVHRG